MSKLFNVPTVLISEVLTLEGKHYDFFRKIFDRVCTLSTRQAKDSETTRQGFEEVLKLEHVPHADSHIKGLMNHFKSCSPEGYSSTFLFHFYALNTLDAAYKYCCQEETKGENSLHTLVFGPDTHNYLVDVIDYLADLEEISTTHLNDKIVKHFIDKAVEKAKKEATMEATQGQSKGGQIRAEKYYSEPKSAIYEAWEKGGFHSYAACAKHFANEFNLSTKTIERWLTKKYSPTKNKAKT
jgi:hypothetical protein